MFEIRRYPWGNRLHRRPVRRRERARVQDGWLAGLTLKGMGLIALLCLIQCGHGGRARASDLDLHARQGVRISLSTGWSGQCRRPRTGPDRRPVPAAIAVVVTHRRGPAQAAIATLRWRLAHWPWPVPSVAGVAVDDGGRGAGPAGPYVEHESRLDPALVAMVPGTWHFAVLWWRRYSCSCARLTKSRRDASARGQRGTGARDSRAENGRSPPSRCCRQPIRAAFLFNISSQTVRGRYGTSLPDAERMLDTVVQVPRGGIAPD